ncbi:unnamed protein product [Chrysodeixis includens]|uniref:Uncharacterized protein n=1 Tax=Chrysodeixis includens TaxID=689277 RepID=A0A9N8PZD2_CHRIL|nr:unnamed protein product [Chrysodeixis includens]
MLDVFIYIEITRLAAKEVVDRQCERKPGDIGPVSAVGWCRQAARAQVEVWSAGGGAGGGTACGSSGMDLKHEVAYRGVLPVKAEPGVSHNGHQANGHVRDWMAGGAGAGSPSPGPPAQPQPNGYSSPLLPVPMFTIVLANSRDLTADDPRPRTLTLFT